MNQNRKNVIVLSTVSLILVVAGAWLILDREKPGGFDAKRAYQDIKIQLAFGARVPGSPAHQETGDWILTELTRAGWETSEQFASQGGHAIRNLIGRRGSGSPWIILGAHYDSRASADQDDIPAWANKPVPGANDSASGVAVLLELARSLPAELPGKVWLVFFDAEDQGSLPGWDWILGSTYFAEHLEGKPDGVVVVDMVGDSDLNLYQERGSDRTLTEAIWDMAGQLGYSDHFIPQVKHEMLDDHVPFLQRGIPAVLLIDFDYPWWHTTGDNLEHVSVDSLEVVGNTLTGWLLFRLGK
jgi:glutaminyl-peptide cyclotransferase